MGKRANRDRSKVPYTIYADRGVAHLNARIAGKRHRPSLGIPYDPESTRGRALREVEEAAARAYAKLVEGRVLDRGAEARVMTHLTLTELGDSWLKEARVLWPKGAGTRTTQLTNVTAWAMTAERFTNDTRTPLERIADDVGQEQYAMDRLGEVIRDTVMKELSNLKRFFQWCVRERHLRSIPPSPEIPSDLKGTRSGPQREEPVDVTADEAIAICEALPEYTRRGGRGKIDPANPPPNAIVVRDVCRLAWELALRPGDVQTFEVGRHWTRGQTYVAFRGDDKTATRDRFGLTDVALEILERHAPESGLIFGAHDLRVQIKRAAIKVLGPERGSKFSEYDFRHARLTHVVETTGSLILGSAMARHRVPTTINRYVRTQERHVATAIAALNEAELVRKRSASLAASGSSGPASQSEGADMTKGVRRAGLEPARCYPLAPQKSGAEDSSRFSAVDASASTPENPASIPGDDHEWSGDGQEGDLPSALLHARRGLAALRFQESNLDAFVLSVLGVIEHEGIQ